MRGLWWKTWRETWLPVEVAVPGCMVVALVLDAWVRRLPQSQAYLELTRIGPDYIAFAFAGLVAALLILAMAEAPRGLGLDRARAFLRTRPHDSRALLGPYVALAALHIAAAFGAILLYAEIVDRPSGRPPLWSFTGLVEWPLVFWLLSGTAMLGALAGSDRRSTGPWVGLALGALTVLETCRMALYPAHGFVQRVALGLLIPGAAAVLAVTDCPAWRRGARVVLVGIVAVCLTVLGIRNYLQRGSPERAVAAVARRAAAGADLQALNHTAEQRSLVEARRASTKWVGAGQTWRMYRRAMDRTVTRALAHPDPRVGDAFVLMRPHLAPRRALAAMRSVPGGLLWCRSGTIPDCIWVQFEPAWPADASEDAALFTLMDMHWQQLARGQRKDSAAFTAGKRLAQMAEDAPSTARRTALLRHIGQWPEWAEERTPAPVRANLTLARHVRPYVAVPEWVEGRPWRTEHPDARLAALIDLSPYAPPWMATEARDLLAATPGLRAGEQEILTTYLPAHEVRGALVARWRAFPYERGTTFEAAREQTPALALEWLREQPLDPTVRSLLQHVAASADWIPRGVGRRWNVSDLSYRRAALAAHLIERVSPQAAILLPGMLGEMVRFLEEVERPRDGLVAVRALEKVTGERHGWDVRAWHRWLARQAPMQVGS